MRLITKEQAREIIDRWLKKDKSLPLAERVYAIEHFLRKLLEEPEVEDKPALPVKKREAKHPVQPLVDLGDGVVRFKPNAIVQFLLNHGRHDLNTLAAMPFSDEDREQFAQLIGYSLYGFADLGYVSEETYARAQEGQVIKK